MVANHEGIAWVHGHFITDGLLRGELPESAGLEFHRAPTDSVCGQGA